MQTRSGSNNTRKKADPLSPKTVSKRNIIPACPKVQKHKSDVTDSAQQDKEHVVNRVTKKSKVSQKDGLVEKRLKIFRDHPPQSYLQRLERALSQRYSNYHHVFLFCILAQRQQDVCPQQDSWRN